MIIHTEQVSCILEIFSFLDLELGFSFLIKHTERVLSVFMILYESGVPAWRVVADGGPGGLLRVHHPLHPLSRPQVVPSYLYNRW